MQCYQCDKEVGYLFGDGRGGCCTRLTKEEITGEVAMEEVAMMNVSNHLFLGGSAHGKLITVTNKATEWKVPLPVAHLPIENRILDYEMYVRHEVVTERRL